MNFTGRITEILMLAGGKTRISLELNERKDIPFKDELLDIEIKKFVKKKSQEANNYMWELLARLAKALRRDRIELYKSFVRKVGVCEIVPIKDADVEKHAERWAKLGLGWFAEVVGKSKLDGYTNVMRYYGTSVYDSYELSLVIDEIIYECGNVGIETKPEAEIRSMMEAWK